MTKTTDSGSKAEGNAVRVCVRVRPLNDKERSNGHRNCVAFDEPTSQVVLQAPHTEALKRYHAKPHHAFAFDYYFGPSDPSHKIYEHCVAKLVENVAWGFNGCVLAYGQTGSGKTHTMSGGVDDEGIIPEAIQNLFHHLEQRRKELEAGGEEVTLKVRVSAMEIYNEELRDLFVQGGVVHEAEGPKTSRFGSAKGAHKARIDVRDARKNSGFSTEVVGLTEKECGSSKDVLKCFSKAGRYRTTATTMMNDHSSRSHAIFTVTIELSTLRYTDRTGNVIPVAMAKSAKFAGGNKHTSTTMSRLNLVDLAGSERVKKSGVEGKELKEASSINSGLLMLGNVICALADRSEGKSTHIPYRDVKLTRILQDSLGGNSLTTLVSCISPSDGDFEESFNTLQYANRACKIKNQALSNTWSQVFEELSNVPAEATSVFSMLSSQLDSSMPRKRGLRRKDLDSLGEELIEVPKGAGAEEASGWTGNFKGRKAAAVARRNRAAQYDMLRRKALGKFGSNMKFGCNSTITGDEVHLTRERGQRVEDAAAVPARAKMLRSGRSASGSPATPSRAGRGGRGADAASESPAVHPGAPPKNIVVSAAPSAGKQMSFADWMKQMAAEEEEEEEAAPAAVPEPVAEEEEVEMQESAAVINSAKEAETVKAFEFEEMRKEVSGKPDGKGAPDAVEIRVDAADAGTFSQGSDSLVEQPADVSHSYLDGSTMLSGEDFSGDALLEDEEEDGLVMADQLEEDPGMRQARPGKSAPAEVEPARAAAAAAPSEDGGSGRSQDLAGDTAASGGLEEVGTSGRDTSGLQESSIYSEEEDAEVLVRFRVNQHIAVTVHKACSKDDFEEVVALLPENTPLPSSDRMIYLLARVIEDMETGEVGRAVGCLMASIGTCMISSCIYSFDDPHEVEQYNTEERVELWGLQIPQPSKQLQEKMAAGGEPPIKEWSSVDRLTMSIGLLFGLCCYADDNDIRAGFCVPRPQLLDRWISAGVPMHGLGSQMQLIYPSHAHDYNYYRSSTVAYFLVDEVIETLGFILAFL
eukprot:jgi/Tetstr1/421339/TSEL_012309.t1